MGAYKQFLTSDVITTPLKIHDHFIINNSGSSSVDYFISTQLHSNDPSREVSRFLGYNLYQYDFNLDIDPYTGNYDIVTPGILAGYDFNITPFHNEATTVGSSSFAIGSYTGNQTIFVITGSTPPPNSYNTIYIPLAATAILTTNAITSSINISSSLFSGIYNITASRLSTNLVLSSKTTGYINNYNYVISSSTTSYFSGGTNDIISGSYQYQRLVYDSIKQLYYSNYLSSIYGDPINRPILIPGRDEEGDRYIGTTGSQAYNNFLQTTLSYPRYFPTATGSITGVLSIPMSYYGEYIKPGSFKMSYDNKSFYDDGEGNLISGSYIIGNIIYTHGIITLVGNEYFANWAASQSANLNNNPGSTYGNAIYGNSYTYGLAPDIQTLILDFVNSTNFTCSFSSSYTIYEKQYKCTIRENEFNFTLNPSTISGSYNTGSNSGVVYDFVTGSSFSPYITTVGLYDEQQNLLAIGKLAQPVPGSPTTDTTILINLDM
jgi:hypothetical protein